MSAELENFNFEDVELPQNLEADAEGEPTLEDEQLEEGEPTLDENENNEKAEHDDNPALQDLLDRHPFKAEEWQLDHSGDAGWRFDGEDILDAKGKSAEYIKAEDKAAMIEQWERGDGKAFMLDEVKDESENIIVTHLMLQEDGSIFCAIHKYEVEKEIEEENSEVPDEPELMIPESNEDTEDNQTEPEITEKKEEAGEVAEAIRTEGAEGVGIIEEIPVAGIVREEKEEPVVEAFEEKIEVSELATPIVSEPIVSEIEEIAAEGIQTEEVLESIEGTTEPISEIVEVPVTSPEVVSELIREVSQIENTVKVSEVTSVEKPAEQKIEAPDTTIEVVREIKEETVEPVVSEIQETINEETEDIITAAPETISEGISEITSEVKVDSVVENLEEIISTKIESVETVAVVDEIAKEVIGEVQAASEVVQEIKIEETPVVVSKETPREAPETVVHEETQKEVTSAPEIQTESTLDVLSETEVENGEVAETPPDESLEGTIDVSEESTETHTIASEKERADQETVEAILERLGIPFRRENSQKSELPNSSTISNSARNSAVMRDSSGSPAAKVRSPLRTRTKGGITLEIAA